jgi:hypothetical protein
MVLGREWVKSGPEMKSLHDRKEKLKLQLHAQEKQKETEPHRLTHPDTLDTTANLLMSDQNGTNSRSHGTNALVRNAHKSDIVMKTAMEVVGRE